MIKNHAIKHCLAHTVQTKFCTWVHNLLKTNNLTPQTIVR